MQSSALHKLVRAWNSIPCQGIWLGVPTSENKNNPLNPRPYLSIGVPGRSHVRAERMPLPPEVEARPARAQVVPVHCSCCGLSRGKHLRPFPQDGQPAGPCDMIIFSFIFLENIQVIMFGLFFRTPKENLWV